MKIHHYLLIAGALLSLAACMSDETKKALATAKEQLAHAKELPNSREGNQLAYYKVTQAKSDLDGEVYTPKCETNSMPPGWCDEVLDTLNALYLEQSVRYERLLAAMDPGAVLELFLQSQKKGDRNAVAQRVLATADKDFDPRLHYAAGLILAAGDYTVKDTSRAVEHFYKAWSQGLEQAAASAADAFRELKDIKNAYMWTLRCTSGCIRNMYLVPRDFENQLTSDDIRQAQAAAQDAKLVQILK